jgi:hypothetical protein
MYDKTVGGYVLKDNSFDMTLIKECAEELAFQHILSLVYESLVKELLLFLNIMQIFSLLILRLLLNS